MRYQIKKCPPLKGTADQKLEQLRAHQNQVVDELTRIIGELERELERIKKEERAK